MVGVNLIAVRENVSWLVSLICVDSSRASGACHRSMQIRNLLENAGWQLQPIQSPPPPASRLITLGVGLAAALRHGPLQPFGVESLRSQGHASHRVAQLHKCFPLLKGVIQEGTGYGSLATVAEWRSRGLTTVLVPANIESLAPNFNAWAHRGRQVQHRFADERRWWAMADFIFTISFEEAWWLRLHGIQAEVLPYFPAPSHQQFLETIRKERNPDPNLGFLWLADFRNPANLAGVSALVSYLYQAGAPPYPVQVVGRGSEHLNECIPPDFIDSFNFRGEVSHSDLAELQCRCIAQLIVHPPTSGRLTRVVDSALAGIPVVGNTMALKGDQLLFQDNWLINRSWPLHPRVIGQPLPPKAAEAAFLATLER
ncbi:hypothetical protein [Synechococcus sp. CBW1006]|uniref:hypothetical protein n=1 Tax=Synechococcus sp. CBW1006 TaxID=1353138 RepID=UPI0018CE602D|nr:hypothetical protein [Synechococcus sp. CBW1006]QPN65924.1 hypothetical protein H8F26_13800 [Synechococcus sp. CBW1006]